MTITLAGEDVTVRDPSRVRRRDVQRAGTTAIDQAVLFAGHAECPSCHAFVRRLTPLGGRLGMGELVAGWCSVCCTTTYFAA